MPRRFTFSSIAFLIACGLLIGFATTAFAKPKKKSKKQRQTSSRIKRDIATQWILLTQSVKSTAVPDNGVFAVNSARETSVTAASDTSANAQFVTDPEAQNRDVHPAVAAGEIIISEFRFSGRNGANDEFIEIYNASGAAHTVTAASGTGYGVVASDGVTRCTIPNGTVIPNRGHYLCVNSVGYSLGTYPANTFFAVGNATYTTDIPDNSGIALFNNNVPADYTLANRLDAVGFDAEANTLYREGVGYPAYTVVSTDYSFYRDMCGKSGSNTNMNPCTIETPKDTNDNAADFVFVDVNVTCLWPVCSSGNTSQRLGAPGPENLSSPIQRNGSISSALLDTCAGKSAAPNQFRDLTSDPPNNSTFGTLDIRRTFTNNTGATVNRLRFRIIDLTAFPSPSGFADLRARSAEDVVVTVDRPPCGVGTSNIVVSGLFLEQTFDGPVQQPNGGGWNSSLSAGNVSLDFPLANGASVDLHFLVGVQQTGTFKLFVNIEVAP